MTRFDKEIDARGLNCPLPLLRTKKMLAQMTAGEVLKVLTTDPAAEIDFKVFADLSGNRLLAVETAEAHQVFFLRKKS
jgi:tRNA 2-thiouridine synthesizing protein A